MGCLGLPENGILQVKMRQKKKARIYKYEWQSAAMIPNHIHNWIKSSEESPKVAKTNQYMNQSIEVNNAHDKNDVIHQIITHQLQEALTNKEIWPLD